jgi:FkbM family methyltransferase
MKIRSIKQFIKNQQSFYSIMLFIRSVIQKRNIKKAARIKGIKINFSKYYIDFIKSIYIVRVSNKHFVYSMDIINSYDYYLNSVIPVNDYNNNLLIDFSTSRYHEVIGYEKQPILFPSLAEPISTTSQYIKFANLKNESVVIDLGAYSGLTSMIFKDYCKKGVVIAIDADELNLKCIESNFKLYKTINNDKIELLSGAIWKDNHGLSFSNEGNMGSSAVSIVGERGGSMKFVNSFTLSDIVDKFSLNRVDFIKCDVEGAEAVIFEDDNFFKIFKPRIIVEPHYVNGILTTEIVKNHLNKYGYKFNLIEQHGYDLPLLQCYFE